MEKYREIYREYEQYLKQNMDDLPVLVFEEWLTQKYATLRAENERLEAEVEQCQVSEVERIARNIREMGLIRDLGQTRGEISELRAQLETQRKFVERLSTWIDRAVEIHPDLTGLLKS